MTVEAKINLLLTQLEGNEAAVNLITNFIFDDNYHENIKILILEQIKQNLTKLEINDDNSDIKQILELSIVTEAINEFNNYAKKADTASCLTPSFNAYRGLTSTVTQKSSVIQELSNNVLSFKRAEPKVLWKQAQLLEFKGETVTIQVSHNAAIFNIQNIELYECWCTDSLDRSKENNTRIKMEQNIINTIAGQVEDKTKKIRLVNIGSDKIGLLVILSKLYLLGYKNIDIINLETKNKEYFLEHQKEQEEYSNLLKTIFADAAYTYLEVYNQSKTNVNLNKRQVSTSAEITVFFAEDLGGLDDVDENKKYTYNSDYRNIIANAVLLVTHLLSPAERNSIFYSKHDGEIISKKSLRITDLLENSNNKKRAEIHL